MEAEVPAAVFDEVTISQDITDTRKSDVTKSDVTKGDGTKDDDPK